MKGYFGLGQLSPTEKSDILDQHKQVYNGYRTMLPQVSNTQPLYVQDFANDKHGITVNNKGEVKRYTNVGINEQTMKSQICNECGGLMYEGECSECGGGLMDEHWQDGDPQYTRLEEGAECSECGGLMSEGECTECGWKGQMDEETGHLDDIYHEEDLNPSDEFDYVKGASNKTNAFHVKEQAEDYINYDDNEDFEVPKFGTKEFNDLASKYFGGNPSNGSDKKYEDDDNEDDGFEDIETGEELDEQGGNSDDMDVDDVEPAFDFESEGPGMGDSYPVNEEGNMDDPEITYDAMESAFNDDEEEMEEQSSVSGVQGIYNDMDPAFDFDSEGPGKAGPYQHSQYESNDDDFDEDELEIDFDEFDPRDKSWEEITAHTGDDEFGHVDEDIMESFMTQKNRIMEMMNRMKVIK